MEGKEIKIEQDFYEYVDTIKELMSPELWENLLLECSKNEIFILWLLYRHEEVNMTQIAEYIHVPLNTATGIIARMQKRKLVIRTRSATDKRVVTIQLGELGKSQIQVIAEEIMYYAGELMGAFSPEEMMLLKNAFEKAISILRKKRKKPDTEPKIRKIPIS